MSTSCALPWKESCSPEVDRVLNFLLCRGTLSTVTIVINATVTPFFVRLGSFSFYFTPIEKVSGFVRTRKLNSEHGGSSVLKQSLLFRARRWHAVGIHHGGTRLLSPALDVGEALVGARERSRDLALSRNAKSLQRGVRDTEGAFLTPQPIVAVTHGAGKSFPKRLSSTVLLSW